MVHPKVQGHIMIVDDTPANLHLLKTILSYHGYTVSPTQDGHEAVDKALETLPDLVLLDVTMPDMDGYDICHALKEHPETQSIPVIFMSALDDTDAKVKAFESGGVDYITKPFQINEVLARINTHLTIRKLQRDLEQQIDELKAFTSTVAHDIKGPISIANGFADLMHLYGSEYPLDDQKKYLKTIFDNTKKATNIVDELLLLAQVGQSDILVETLQMDEIMGQVSTRIESYITEYGGTVSYASDWPAAVGYGPWIEEVWINYINNALKYGGEPAEVTVGAERLSPTQVKFFVQDRGDGLSEEEQNKLFIEFTRIHNAAQEREGTGLGLSIVKRIVEKLGGYVGVKSEVGKGSQFYFVLPAPS